MKPIVDDDVLADVFSALETAAWARRWRDVQVCRQRIEHLTGIRIDGRLRRELERDAASAVEASGREEPS